jgi:hypothetical protein
MSRDYWKYFRDDLHYPEIQNPGPLALLAQGEAGELGSLFQSGLKMRDQFLPARAEEEGVIIHGQARGVPRLARESAGQHRLRVTNAFAWQRQAGRHWGLYQIFADYGLPIEELTYLQGDRWAEFDLKVKTGHGLGDDDWDFLYWLIFEYKRAIAMPRTVRLGKLARGTIFIKAGAALGEKYLVYPPARKPPEPRGTVLAKMAVLTHEKWVVYPVRTKTYQRFQAPYRAGMSFKIN